MKKYLPLIVVVMACAMVVPIAHAQSNNLGYTPLEPIPGLTTDLTNGNNLPSIINAIFKILITIGALFAVLMLTVGGIQYMVSASAEMKATGIDKAKAALWGIVLLAASWLILYTINPNLLNFSLNPCPAGAVGCTVTGPSTTASGTNTASALPTPDVVSKDTASAAVNSNVATDPSNPNQALSLTVPLGCAPTDPCGQEMRTKINNFNAACSAQHGTSQVVSGTSVGGTSATQDYICKTQ